MPVDSRPLAASPPILALALSLCAVGVAPGDRATGAGAQAAMEPQTGALRPPEVPWHHRFGVAHILPRYLPGGRLGPDILVAGALDAHRLGFRTIKVGLNGQVLAPNLRYYSLPPEMLQGVTNLVELAELEPYRQLLDLPFQTFFIAADAIGPGNWDELAAHPPEGAPPVPDPPLSEEAKRNIYDQIYRLSEHLLTRYRGSGKIFVLQNHEGDWHTVPHAKAELDPSPTALENTRIYLELRQRAVDDARRRVGATDVYLYHMVEVNLVDKAMRGGRTVTNDVLPLVRCDLVGYSAYDTSLVPGGRFLEALAYLRSRAADSFAFGDNNVVISEIGVPERTASPEQLRAVVEAHLQAVVAGVPWSLQWNLYDNDCAAAEDGLRVLIDDPGASQCSGFWVRRPDGSPGQFFRTYQPYLDPAGPLQDEPTDAAEYAGRLYRSVLGREIDPEALAAAVAQIEARPWAKEDLLKLILASPEYQERTAGGTSPAIVDIYRVVLGRDPEPALAPALASASLPTAEDRAAYIDDVLDSEEARRRFVRWLFGRYLGRPPLPEEVDAWARLLAAGRPRQAVLGAFVAGLTRP